MTHVPLTIRFEHIRLATPEGGEEARIGLANDHLVAVLVPLADERFPQGRGWYLETGFGPCQMEGLLFPTLDSAETWIRQQIPETWAPAAGTEAPTRADSDTDS